MIKQSIVLLFAFLMLAPVSIAAQIFEQKVNVSYPGGIMQTTPMKFVVIDDKEKTCAVYGNYEYKQARSYYYICMSDTVKGNVQIPETANGYKVVAINQYAFNGCRFSEITIPSSITSIGNGAFSQTWGLTKIDLPPLITEIPDGAFYKSNLQEVSIPSSVKKIASTAFSGSKVVSIDLPSSLSEIGDYAFSQCYYLNNITIPQGVTKMGKSIFWECTKLSYVVIPYSVKEIGNGIFQDCSKKIKIVSFSPALITCNSSGHSDLTFYVLPSLVGETKTQNTYKGITTHVPTVYPIVETQTTQTTATLKSYVEEFQLTSAFINNVEYYSDNGIVVIKNLISDETYDVSIKGTTSYGDEISDVLSIKTQPMKVYLNLIDATNLTLRVKGTYEGDAKVIETTAPKGENEEWTITNLKPGQSSSVSYEITTEDGKKYSTTNYFSTKSISVDFKDFSGPTTISLKALPQIIDATFVISGFENTSLDSISYHGLDPSTSYTKRYYYETKEGGRQYWNRTVKTTSLTLTTKQPKVVSVGNVIVAAESNLDDEETNVGFEWRRTDWTDDFSSNTGGAYLFEGTMEGYIRNLYTEKLWKYRPYYTSNSGQTYYGDWVGIDPTNTSYFEPTVHTYAKVDIDEGKATLNGYVMTGTDAITEQGFEYWETDGGSQAKQRAPQNVKTITATGQRMSATLTGLKDATTYGYRAYVKTAGGTTYGEERSFTIPVSTGIAIISKDAPSSVQSRYFNVYTLSGVLVRQHATSLNGLPKGIYIVKGRKFSVK